MHRILVVTDVPWTSNEVHAVLTTPDFELIDTDDPRTAARLAHDEGVDAVVVDLQVGSMGGMAVAREVRNIADLEDRPYIPSVLLLDRAADGFLARRAGAAAWVVKPLTGDDLALQVQRAIVGTSQDDVAVVDEVVVEADDETVVETA